jgi:hypothetical protein
MLIHPRQPPFRSARVNAHSKTEVSSGNSNLLETAPLEQASLSMLCLHLIRPLCIQRD